jgi:hypothetical protein
MPVKSECLKIKFANQHNLCWSDQYFSYKQNNIITTQESHSEINFTNILWLYHWYSVLILVFNFH